jgi:uncharacterized protein (TIGR03083 family)
VTVPSATDYWTLVEQYRLQLADRLGELSDSQWDADSRCEGWRVRDVVGHLVNLGESSHASMTRDFLRHGFLPDKVVSAVAMKVGQDSGPNLVNRLRASSRGRFHVPLSPRQVVLGEVLVHGTDALEPLGLSLDIRPEDAGLVLDTYRRVGRFAFHTKSVSKAHLVASDVSWSAGSGPEVRGQAFDLLQLMANRRQVTERLTGPGVSSL